MAENPKDEWKPPDRLAQALGAVPREKPLDTERYGYKTNDPSWFGKGGLREAIVGGQPSQNPVESHDSDRNFYVAIAAYGAAFGTGLFLLGDNTWFSGGWIYGAILTAGGGIGLMSVTPLFRPKLEALRSPRSLWAVITMTWLLLAANLGFAVYDHFGPIQPKGGIPTSPEIWPALTKAQTEALSARVRFIPAEEITVACETLNCRDLADGIAEILQKTPGWKVSILHRGGLDIDGVAGIELDPNEPATQGLKEAIEATTGLAVTVGPDVRKDFGNSPALLVVGIRPF